MKNQIKKQVDALLEQDLFEMSNLFPRTTGLPFTIGVSPATGDRHLPRLKVEILPGVRVPISIENEPKQLAGERLKSKDLQAIVNYILLNKAVLLLFWSGKIDAAELTAQLAR